LEIWKFDSLKVSQFESFSYFIKSMLTDKSIEKINDYAKNKIPFLFIIDYALEKIIIEKIEDCEAKNIFFKINENTNFPNTQNPKKEIVINKKPISFEEYKAAFDVVQKHLVRGDSFLVNLTKPTEITLNLSLQEVFEFSHAKYKLYFDNQFVVFSPEIFVKIKDGIITSHPMKGTICAEIADAEKIILHDKKELAEHTTIVDLIRNDLSMVCEKVWVERFRYIDRIKTHSSEILQVSSEIKGKLNLNWRDNLSEILLKLLPAGSISGAPKPETLRIIKDAENYDRGYYTGIFGIFDGENLDSGVMIRFIEQTKKGLIFKSGGGITTQSKAATEYKELIDKIYVPMED
jgi:para-aminobenzoate synthetase component I